MQNLVYSTIVAPVQHASGCSRRASRTAAQKPPQSFTFAITPVVTRRDRSRSCRHARGAVAVSGAAATLTQEVLVLDKCTPLGKRILLVPDELEQKSAGGILLPTNSAKQGNFITGEVVGVGEGVVGVTVGQRVLISGYGGVEVDFQGRKAKFVNDTEVLGVWS